MKPTLVSSLVATWMVALVALHAQAGEKAQTGISTIAANKPTVRPGDIITITAAVVYDHDFRDRTPRVPLLGIPAQVEFTTLGTKKRIQVNPATGVATYTFQVPKSTVPDRSYNVSGIVLENVYLRASVQKSCQFRVKK